jgi:hypothetical protein
VEGSRYGGVVGEICDTSHLVEICCEREAAGTNQASFEVSIHTDDG